MLISIKPTLTHSKKIAMKKNTNLLLIAAALFAATTMSAQQTTTMITPTPTDDHRDEFGFGVKGGINVSNVYDEEGEGFVADNRVGFYGGVFVSVPLGTYIGLQPEILYSQKGFKGKGSIGGPLIGTTSYDFERTSDYLDIPLQLQIKPIKELTFLVGPQYSYLMNTKDEFRGGGVEFTQEQEEELSTDNIKKNIFGFVVGAEANFSGFLISARAGWDITKSDADGDSVNPRYKNQVLQFGVGYTFY